LSFVDGAIQMNPLRLYGTAEFRVKRRIRKGKIGVGMFSLMGASWRTVIALAAAWRESPFKQHRARHDSWREPRTAEKNTESIVKKLTM